MPDRNPLITATCPHCNAANITMELLAVNEKGYGSNTYYGFCVCRKCYKPSIFILSAAYHNATYPMDKSWNDHVIDGAFNNKLASPIFSSVARCPEYVPDDIVRIFDEASKCYAVGCFDAAGAMYRKVLDATTRGRVGVEPESVERGSSDYISFKQYKDLRLRLDWLFDRNKLPQDLRELISCVHLDGNEAAHSLEKIGPEIALDLQDFTTSILENIFTVPGRIADNISRREARRASTS